MSVSGLGSMCLYVYLCGESEHALDGQKEGGVRTRSSGQWQ